MKKSNNKYTPEQTKLILENFALCSSYEEQIITANNLAVTPEFSGWNTSHTAKQILSKVVALSRPAVEPVLNYIKRPVPAPKLKILPCLQLIKVLRRAGYNPEYGVYNAMTRKGLVFVLGLAARIERCTITNLLNMYLDEDVLELHNLIEFQD